jgi:beta-lactamase class A
MMHRLWLSAFALVAFVVACGSSSSKPEPTLTAQPTASLEATSTQAPATTVEQQQPTSPAHVGSSSCGDPYVNGAPFPATPAQSLRLHPTGTAPAIAQFQPIAMSEDAALERVVRDSVGAESAHFAVVVKRLDNGSGVSIDAGRLFYPASLFKTWVMIEAYHQRDAGLLDFGERYVVSNYYAGLRLNDGELAPCSEVTADQALHAMIQVSDNVAANLLYDRVGYSNVNDTLRQLGLAFSGLATGGDLQTTAGGMATVFEAIGRGKAVSPGASEEMVAVLEGDAINDRIPALLPPGTPVAHKTGNWSNATHDVGIVYSPNATYVIAVLTDYGYADGGAVRIARLSKAVYDYYNPAG